MKEVIPVSKVCIVGTGYVGLITGACLAEMGNRVLCVDRDGERIARLNRGVMPIYEPGLEEIVSANRAEGRLSFTTDLASAVRESLICFIAVGTPQGPDGSADLASVLAVAREIGESMESYRVVVVKSTVPVGTCARIKTILQETTREAFSVVSNPEFLKQGDAVNDFLKPERVVIGTDDARSQEVMRGLYAPFMRTGNPIIALDIVSAEMTKYVANAAFLATKISFMNEMATLCEQVGADIDQVRTGICSDSRIGHRFLFPGVGYGGSCLPKDVRALLHTASEHDCECPIIGAVDQVNQRQKARFVARLLHHLGQDLVDKTVALWGLSFKPRTDDLREAPSVQVVEALHARGARIQAYDPRAMDSARRLLGDKLELYDDAYSPLRGAHALVIMTEWNEFRRPSFERMARLMRDPVIFDGRNLYELERMAQRGFRYYCVGRPTREILIPLNGCRAAGATA
jgi:UDPglucose 6-dehydrogenase